MKRTAFASVLFALVATAALAFGPSQGGSGGGGGSSPTEKDWTTLDTDSAWGTTNVTNSGRYMDYGTHLSLVWTHELTGAPSGSLSVELPESKVIDTDFYSGTGTGARYPVGTFEIYDNGTGWYEGTIWFDPTNTSTLKLSTKYTGGNSLILNGGIVNPTTPIPYASGDKILCVVPVIYVTDP